MVAMTSHAIITIVQHLTSADSLEDTEMVYAVVYLVLPLSVLVVNLLVVCEVRRASNNASTNLGLRLSQQATSSNSALYHNVKYITHGLNVIKYNTIQHN